MEAKNPTRDNLLHTLNNECLKSEILCVFSSCFEGWSQGISNCPLLESLKRLQFKTFSFFRPWVLTTGFPAQCINMKDSQGFVDYTVKRSKVSHVLLHLYSVLCIAVDVKDYYKMRENLLTFAQLRVRAQVFSLRIKAWNKTPGIIKFKLLQVKAMLNCV